MTVRERNRLIEDLASARALVMQTIDGLTEGQMSVQGLDGWSVKDLLIHLTVCDEIRFHEIGRVSRGGMPGYANLVGTRMDDFNDIVVSLRRPLTLRQVVEDLASAREFVLQAIAAAPEHALSPELYGDYAVNGSISHDTEHAAAIRAWREREGI